MTMPSHNPYFNKTKTYSTKRRTTTAIGLRVSNETISALDSLAIKLNTTRPALIRSAIEKLVEQ